MRRGFKAEAERIAAEVRSEMSLQPTDRLDPLSLAGHLGVSAVRVRDLHGHATRLDLLLLFAGTERDAFSALTLFVGTSRLIVYNDAHAATRRASNIAHEIAHCLLEHEPGPAVSAEGCRVWNETMEKEADWLGAALLMPRDGALGLLAGGLAIDAVARNFGISDDLARWRINQTGVALQIRRMRRWRRI